MNNGSTYVYKDYSYVPGFRGLVQDVIDFFSWFKWLWLRIIPFEGQVVKIEKDPVPGTNNFRCSALLIKDSKGKQKWRNCNLYPYHLAGVGETMGRHFFLKLYFLRGKEKVRISWF